MSASPHFLKRPLRRESSTTVAGDAVSTLWSTEPPKRGKLVFRNLDGTLEIWVKLRKFGDDSATFTRSEASYIAEAGQQIEMEVPGNCYFDLINSSGASTTASYRVQEFA
jgi:hypothetical protein